MLFERAVEQHSNKKAEELHAPSQTEKSWVQKNGKKLVLKQAIVKGIKCECEAGLKVLLLRER